MLFFWRKSSISDLNGLLFDLVQMVRLAKTKQQIQVIGVVGIHLKYRFILDFGYYLWFAKKISFDYISILCSNCMTNICIYAPYLAHLPLTSCF